MSRSAPHSTSNPSGAGASGAREPPACRDEEARALLVRYVLARCSEEEAIRFEGHLLLCDLCFEDVKVLDRAGILLRGFLDEEGEHAREDGPAE